MPDKPTRPAANANDSDKPNTNRAQWGTRLQVLTLGGGEAFVLIFDQWDGPRLPESAIRGIKTETGARGVLFFEGTVDIDC